MTKSKKILVCLIAGLIILALVVQLTLNKIISKHISKTIIIEQLEKVTGYHVTIDGPLQWHYSLHPGLGLEKITFKSNDDQIIQLESTTINIQLLPLFKKHFVIDFNFQQWQQNQLHFSNGTGHIDFENNFLTLSKFNAHFYQGTITGEAKVDLNSTEPTFNINLKTDQVEISGLLKDIAQSASVSGKMNAQATLNSYGTNATDFIDHLNGNISALVKKGKLNTIHFSQFIPNIVDIFDDLKINSRVTNGIANTNIELLEKNYRASGKGNINFNQESLNLKLNVYYTNAQQTKNIAIPVGISGQIASPSISVDVTQPLNQILKTNRKKLLNNFNHLFNQP